MNLFRDHRTKFINDGVHIEGAHQIIDIPRMKTKEDMREVYRKRQTVFAAGVLALTALTLGVIDRVKADDTVACTSVSADDDQTTRRAASDLRYQGAYIKSFREVTSAYNSALEANPDETDVNVCYKVRTGISGAILDVINHPEPVVGPQADDLQAQN